MYIYTPDMFRSQVTYLASYLVYLFPYICDVSIFSLIFSLKRS